LYSQETTNTSAENIESTAFELLNKKTPYFIAKTLSGETITPESFYGHVTLLQFMYFPCGPCMMEIPQLNKLHEKFIDKGLKIIAVIPNRPIDIETYQEAKDTNSIFCMIRHSFNYEKIKYQILSECENNNVETKKNQIGATCQTLSKLFKRDYYPINYLIDKKGTIRKIYVGFNTLEKEREIAKMENDIKELLIEK
jgi:thiol-disulfide isomerase/thioredoxin